MYSLIGFSNAVVVEAVILKATRNRMRVVLVGLDDVLELRRVGSEWFSETGEAVTVEFLAADAPASATQVDQPLMSRAAS